jgi:hypothetical protein
MRPIRWQVIALAAALALAAPAWSRAGERPNREPTAAAAPSPSPPIQRPIRGRSVRLPPPSAAPAEPASEEVHRHDEPKPTAGGPQAQEPVPPGTEAEPESAAATSKALNPGTGFDGIAGGTSGTWPPDPTSATSPPIGAAGTQYVVETVNEGLQVFDQNGGQATAYIPFWSPTTGFFSRDATHHDVIFDPRVVFDPYAQRFFIIALENGKDGKGYLHIAVSASNDPRGAWTTFKTDTLGPAGQNFLPDYPSLGFDRQAIYIGLNLFLVVPPAGRPDGLLYRAISKATMLDNSNPRISVRVSRFETLLPPQYQWAMRAAQVFDLPLGATAEGLFIGPFRDVNNPATQFQRLRVVKMRNPLDNNLASLATFDLPVPGYREPAVDAPQGATPCGTAPGPIDVSSGQLLNAVWRRDDLYAAHTVRRIVGTVTSNAARWYQVRTGPPTAPVTWSQLVQSGDVLADATGAKHTYLPTVGVDANRSLVVAYAQSSAGEAVSFRAAARAACAAEGILQSFLLVKREDFCYEQGGPPHRWGDFWSLAVDPASATRLWATGEYVKAKNTWGTWIEPLELIPDCPPCSCSQGL